MEKIEEKKQRKNKYLLELGNQIRDVRNSRGLTQEELADMVGIAPSYLSEVETGKSNVTFLILLRIAKQLGCDVAAFSKNIPE